MFRRCRGSYRFSSLATSQLDLLDLRRRKSQPLSQDESKVPLRYFVPSCRERHLYGERHAPQHLSGLTARLLDHCRQTRPRFADRARSADLPNRPNTVRDFATCFEHCSRLCDAVRTAFGDLRRRKPSRLCPFPRSVVRFRRIRNSWAAKQSVLYSGKGGRGGMGHRDTPIDAAGRVINER